MTRRVSPPGWILLALVALLVALVGLGGCGGGAGFRAKIAEASAAVRAHDQLHAEVVLGRADGLARRGGCAVCRY